MKKLIFLLCLVSSFAFGQQKSDSLLHVQDSLTILRSTTTPTRLYNMFKAIIDSKYNREDSIGGGIEISQVMDSINNAVDTLLVDPGGASNGDYLGYAGGAPVWIPEDWFRLTGTSYMTGDVSIRGNNTRYLEFDSLAGFILRTFGDDINFVSGGGMQFTAVGDYNIVGGNLLSLFSSTTLVLGSTGTLVVDLSSDTGTSGEVLGSNGTGGVVWGQLAPTALSGWPSNASGVLTNNGSGTLSWGAGGGITSSGTPANTYLATWTSSTNLTGTSSYRTDQLNEVFARSIVTPTNGTNITWTDARVYTNSGANLTGNITDSFSGTQYIGIVQKIYHEDSTPPTFPANWVLLGGSYVTNETNIIYCEWFGSTRVEYWIAQEQ